MHSDRPLPTKLRKTNKARGKPNGSPRALVHAVHEVVGDKSDKQVGKRVARRPTDNGRSDRPDLGKRRGDLIGVSPSAPEVSENDGTHDVNDEMLTKAYGRGLRVGFVGYVTSDSYDPFFRRAR